MDNRDNFQLELFSGAKDVRESGARRSGGSFLNHIRRYEKIILVIIGMMITSIISFSLGVERGKQLRVSTFRPIAQQATDANEPKETAVIKAGTKVEPLPLEKQGYMIQLASYKTKTHAQKEVDLLKKNGFSPLVLTKGSYAVLYVGNLSNKKTAQSLLAELKKRYKDCYIRRL